VSRVHHTRAFTLIELMAALSAAAIILSVLGKLLVDGIYLQRIAGERLDRLAVVDTMIERLRADALGAAANAWDPNAPSPTLTLLACDGARREHIEWIFRGGNVIRRVDAHETDGFRASRVRFAARIDRGDRFDVLVVTMTVQPPARAHSRPPREFSEPVLLPGGTASAADAGPGRQP